MRPGSFDTTNTSRGISPAIMGKASPAPRAACATRTNYLEGEPSHSSLRKGKSPCVLTQEPWKSSPRSNPEDKAEGANLRRVTRCEPSIRLNVEKKQPHLSSGPAISSYQELRPDIVDQVINVTFQIQQGEGSWTEVRSNRNPRPSYPKTVRHKCSSGGHDNPDATIGSHLP